MSGALNRKRLREAARHVRLLNVYTEQAYPLLREWMRADGCIAATRVTLDVMAYFGLIGAPLVVQTDVFNPPFAKLAERLGRFPTPDEVMAQDDTWVVSIGFPRDEQPDSILGHLEGRWHGHLVALFPVGQVFVMVDASLRQAERPAKQIALPDILTLTVSPEFVAGEDGHMVRDVERGCLIGYRTRREYDPYIHAPDWREGVYGEVTLRLITLLKGVEE